MSMHPLTALVIIGVALALPGAPDAQGWWGAPANPGFDRNTVIAVAGTMTQADLAPWGGPSTFRLETAQEVFTVMLAPGWFLATLHPDFRIGDPVSVEGSKMMDHRGNLHVVAARVTNQRTGSVLELRDEFGQPRWMGGHPWGNGR